MILWFLSRKLKKNPGIQITRCSSNCKSLSNEQVMSLEVSITESEVKNAVWACVSDKISGLDSLTFVFIFFQILGVVKSRYLGVCGGILWYMQNTFCM